METTGGSTTWAPTAETPPIIDNKMLFTALGGLDLDNIEYLADLKAKKGDEWKPYIARAEAKLASEEDSLGP